MIRLNDKKIFELIPDIDLKGGHCVRLKQGRMENATDYGADTSITVEVEV